MNTEELRGWQDCVLIHTENLKNVRQEREKLKEVIIEHLSQFFTWSEIEFKDDFNKITLYYSHGVDAVIKGNISELGMEWIVSSSHDRLANNIVVIEIYPFGLPEEDKIVWDE